MRVLKPASASLAAMSRPTTWMDARSVQYNRRIIDPMSLDPTWLFVSLIPSGIGFVLFVYGKKQQRWPHMLAGIVFTVYPYFTESIGAMLAVGAGLGAALWAAIRMGW
jgi:hypothetical protein